MKTRRISIGLMFILINLFVLDMASEARLGGGGSFGSRGSRTTTSPSSPAPRQTSPAPTPSQTSPPPQSSLFGGGFGRGLMGGIAGGILGGMLFRSLGFASEGMGQGGRIGLFEILLMAGLAYGIYWWVKKRQTLAYSPAGSSASSYSSLPYAGGENVSSVQDVEEGLKKIGAMDPRFTVESFKEQITETFFKVQVGWGKRELALIARYLTPEMNEILEREMTRLKVEKKTNHIENISIRQVEPVEAWQEEGNDFITVLISANLLDFTRDDQTGAIVAGSETEPISFKEYWTYVRPVGGGPWRLSAIGQASNLVSP